MFWRISKKNPSKMFELRPFSSWNPEEYSLLKKEKHQEKHRPKDCPVFILVFHLSLSVSNSKRQKESNISQAPICFTGVISQSPFFSGPKAGLEREFFHHSVTSAPILPVQVSQTNRSRNSRQRPLRKSPQRLKGVCVKMCVWDLSFIRMTDGQTYGEFPCNFGDFPKPKPPILVFFLGRVFGHYNLTR